jgi:aconitate hydratase
MNPFSDPFKTLSSLEEGLVYYSLPLLEKIAPIQRLPVSIRIMLESLLRNCDGKRVREEDVIRLANWNSKKPNQGEVPFCVARVLLQDFTGVPLLVDLAAMRDAAHAQGADPKSIEPEVPVDLVIDHSVQVDRAGTADAFLFNLQVEFGRNKERYEFLKWGQQAFQSFQVVPPGIGICHQVNLEHLASVVAHTEIDGKLLLFPDTLVGTDSHTTMINGLGVLGWGVGGIEAEAAMLGQPVSIETPEVIGVLIEGSLRDGVTATDLTLRITEMLRKEKVVGKFVEFFGEGAASLTVADRATIGNMAPEYGATVGFFPVDDKTLEYLRLTGRDEKKIKRMEAYLKAQKLFGIPKRGEIEPTKTLELDLSTVEPSIAGPKRPQDRIALSDVKTKFQELLTAPIPSGGYGKIASELEKKIPIHAGASGMPSSPPDSGGTEAHTGPKAIWSEQEMLTNRPFTKPLTSPGYMEGVPYDAKLSHGTVVIAAITSCTNTSNPSVMIGAGLLAKKAVERGLKVPRFVKTSLAPGSRVVTDYLEETGLQKYLDVLGFQLVAYGCTTCIGNSGPLDAKIEDIVNKNDLVVASVLSGNRNFEARIHGSVKANFLMSPPLVVAYALHGSVIVDWEKEPVGIDIHGKPVFLKELWPSDQEIQSLITKGLHPEMFKKRYARILKDNPVWDEIEIKTGAQVEWDPASTYIRKPPFFEMTADKKSPSEKMHALALFGDSVTTDHISPAGAITASSPAGHYLLEKGVKESDFNSYGSRRGNHEVMMRGTFANVRIRNQLAGGKEGGLTQLFPDHRLMAIYDACQVYAERGIPLLVFAGKDYGMGSSRDWAAKGTALLGVKVVIAESFERIHRSNLIGMGVLPLVFREGETRESHGITGEELFSIPDFHPGKLKAHQEITLEIHRKTTTDRIQLRSSIHTPIEVEYYQQGGILPFVLKATLARK